MSTNDPFLNLTFNCLADKKAGVIFLDVGLGGASLNATFTGDAAITLDGLAVSGYGVLPTLSEDQGPITLTLELSGEGISNSQKGNWIAWSKIGSVDFELDSTNDAGNRPMKWSGYVYAILPLGKNAVVYGSEGVSIIYPVESPFATFGFKDINRVGVWSKDAVCGTQTQHFFINRVGQLWRLSEEKGLELLNYSEFFEGLVNPTIHYDEDLQRALIGDDSIGYTLTLNGLGGGFAEVTGYARVNGEVVVASPGDLEYRALEFTTDIIDFKHRGMKSIESVQVGTDTNEELFVAYDYRFSKDDAFRTTLWSRVNREGVAHLKASGVEFRIKLRALLAHEFDVDYITIQFKNIDRRFTRGPRESVG